MALDRSPITQYRWLSTTYCQDDTMSTQISRLVREQQQLLRELIRARDMTIVEKYRAGGMSYAEIAREHGITRARVQQILAAAE